MDPQNQIAGILFANRQSQRDFFKIEKSRYSAQFQLDICAGDSRLIRLPSRSGKRGFQLHNISSIKTTKIFVGFLPTNILPTSPEEKFDQFFYRLNGQIFYNWEKYLGAFSSTEPILFTADSDSGQVTVSSGPNFAKFDYSADTALCPFIFYKDVDVDISLILNLSAANCDLLPTDYKGWND